MHLGLIQHTAELDKVFSGYSQTLLQKTCRKTTSIHTLSRELKLIQWPELYPAQEQPVKIPTVVCMPRYAAALSLPKCKGPEFWL